MGVTGVTPELDQSIAAQKGNFEKMCVAVGIKYAIIDCGYLYNIFTDIINQYLNSQSYKDKIKRGPLTKQSLLRLLEEGYVELEARLAHKWSARIDQMRFLRITVGWVLDGHQGHTKHTSKPIDEQAYIPNLEACGDYFELHPHVEASPSQGAGDGMEIDGTGESSKLNICEDLATYLSSDSDQRGSYTHRRINPKPGAEAEDNLKLKEIFQNTYKLSGNSVIARAVLQKRLMKTDVGGKEVGFLSLPRFVARGVTASDDEIRELHPFLPDPQLHGNDRYKERKDEAVKILQNGQTLVSIAPGEADDSLQTAFEIHQEAFDDMTNENSVVVSKDSDASYLVEVKYFATFPSINKPHADTTLLLDRYQHMKLLDVTQSESKAIAVAIGRDLEPGVERIGLITARKYLRYHKHFIEHVRENPDASEPPTPISIPAPLVDRKKRKSKEKKEEEDALAEEEKRKKDEKKKEAETDRIWRNWYSNLPYLKASTGLDSNNIDTDQSDSNLRKIVSECDPDTANTLIGIIACHSKKATINDLNGCFAQLHIIDTGVSLPANFSGFVQMTPQKVREPFYQEQPPNPMVTPIPHSTSPTTHAGAAVRIQGTPPKSELEEPQRGRGTATGPMTLSDKMESLGTNVTVRPLRVQVSEDQEAESPEQSLSISTGGNRSSSNKKAKTSTSITGDAQTSRESDSHPPASAPEASTSRSAGFFHKEFPSSEPLATKMPANSSKNSNSFAAQTPRNKELAAHGFQGRNGGGFSSRTLTEQTKTLLKKRCSFVSRSCLSEDIVNPTLLDHLPIWSLLVNVQQQINGTFFSLLSTILRNFFTNYQNYDDWKSHLYLYGTLMGVDLDRAVRAIFTVALRGQEVAQDQVMVEPEATSSAPARTGIILKDAIEAARKAQKKGTKKKETESEAIKRLLPVVEPILPQIVGAFPPTAYMKEQDNDADLHRFVFNIRAFWVQSFFKQIEQIITSICLTNDKDFSIALLSSKDGNKSARFEDAIKSVSHLVLSLGNVSKSSTLIAAANSLVTPDLDGNIGKEAASNLERLDQLKNQVEEQESESESKEKKDPSFKEKADFSNVESIKKLLRKKFRHLGIPVHEGPVINAIELLAQSIFQFYNLIWVPIVENLKEWSPELPCDDRTGALSPAALAATKQGDLIAHASHAIAVAPVDFSCRNQDQTNFPSRSTTAQATGNPIFVNGGKQLGPKQSVARCSMSLGSEPKLLTSIPTPDHLLKNGKDLVDHLIKQGNPAIRSYLTAHGSRKTDSNLPSEAMDVDPNSNGSTKEESPQDSKTEDDSTPVDKNLPVEKSNRRRSKQVSKPKPLQSIYEDSDLWKMSPFEILEQSVQGKKVSGSDVKLKPQLQTGAKNLRSALLLNTHISVEFQSVPDEQLSSQMLEGRKRYESEHGANDREKKMSPTKLWGIVRQYSLHQSLNRGIFSKGINFDLSLTHATFCGDGMEITALSWSKIKGPAPILPEDELPMTTETYWENPLLPQHKRLFHHHLEQLPSRHQATVREKTIHYTQAPVTAKPYKAIKEELKTTIVNKRNLTTNEQFYFLLHIKTDDRNRMASFKQAMKSTTELSDDKKNDPMVDKQIATSGALVSQLTLKWKKDQGNVVPPALATGRIAPVDHSSKSVQQVDSHRAVFLDNGTHGAHFQVSLPSTDDSTDLKSIRADFKNPTNLLRITQRPVRKMQTQLTNNQLKSIEMGGSTLISEAEHKSRVKNSSQALNGRGRSNATMKRWADVVVNTISVVAGGKPANIEPEDGGPIELTTGDGSWSTPGKGSRTLMLAKVVLQAFINRPNAFRVQSVNEELSSQLSPDGLGVPDEIEESGSQGTFIPTERDPQSGLVVRPRRFAKKDRFGRPLNKVMTWTSMVWDATRKKHVERTEVRDRDVASCEFFKTCLRHLKYQCRMPMAFFGLRHKIEDSK